MTNAQRREANVRRRELTAMKQRPLPMRDKDADGNGIGQLDRAERNAAAKAERYPRPPLYDATAAVRGRPEDRNTPQPVFIFPRFKSGRAWFTPPVPCRVR